jgi:hypothetical protein
MPANCCPKWKIDGTGKARNRPLTDIACDDKYAIRDTWACMWEKCPGIRDAWKRHARESEQKWKDWDPGYPGEYTTQFAQYFTETVLFGDDYKVGRICLDLSWLTHTYFLGTDPEAYRCLLDE